MSDERERRLDALREEAARRGHVDGAGIPIAGGPIPPQPVDYYGQPLLKAPVWTWEVPAYFFTGGAAGAAAVIAAIAQLTGADLALARDARWIALAGAAISPALLISDLGRPAQFLNMLRVFKWQSAMSVGAWTLVGFSTAIALSTLLHVSGVAARWLWTSGSVDVLAATGGLVLASYTGVLLGVTAVPVWAAHARRLPLIFGASSLGAAISIVELAGHVTPAANLVGMSAAAVDLLFAIRIGRAADRASAPLHVGRSAGLIRSADALGGAVPLVLRMAAATSPGWRAVAAVSTILGSIVLRYGWIAAGRVSTTDPAAALEPRATR